MNPLQITRKLNRLVMAGIAFMSFVAATNAQVKTESTTIHEPATKTVSIDRGEVVGHPDCNVLNEIGVTNRHGAV